MADSEQKPKWPPLRVTTQNEIRVKKQYGGLGVIIHELGFQPASRLRVTARLAG